MQAEIILQNMRAAGLGKYIDAATEGVDTVCQMAGYQAPPTQALMVRPGAPPAQPPIGANGNPGLVRPTPGTFDCGGLVPLVRNQYYEQCGMIPNCHLEQAILFAILLSSYAQVRDDFGIPDLSLEVSGLKPTGVAANGAPTTFVDKFNVAPGESILLRTQSYRLPFHPRCLWGALAFNGGTPESNYANVLFKVWVGPSNLAALPALQGGALREWSPRRFIYGSQFRCGDACQEVPLRSYSGCTEVDIVGIESSIYIQVDNLATATQNITGQQLVLKLGGFEKPCCDSCQRGHACGCSAKH